MATTSSPSRLNRAPVTPPAGRPIARTSVSSNRIASPLLVPSMMWSLPPVTLDVDERIAFFQADRDDAVGADVGVGAQGGLLHRSLGGGEDQELLAAA